MSQPPRLTADAALFLDFDGTLVALAGTPEAVEVPPVLIPLLRDLHEVLGGALAVVSGRPIGALDGFLAPLRLPAAGEHGMQRRDAEGCWHEQPAPDLASVFVAADELARAHAGLRVERKRAAVALHYRQAPALEAACRDVMRQAVAGRADLELMHGKCVFEVKPAGVGKGGAIDAFMREPPFAGRAPVFAGDDTTDESGFAAVQARGGVAIKVGAGPSVARWRLASPRAVLDWLGAARGTLASSTAGG
jgi:trehalose 6-phosphate phosphatase